MPSRNEKQTYDSGFLGKRIENPETYNPLDIRLKPIPEETVCALCHSKADYVFPITDMILCLEHAEIMAEYKDVKVTFKPHADITGRSHCAVCGKPVIYGVRANTHICNKCTIKLGKMQEGIRIQEAAKARKVVKDLNVRKVI